MNLYDALEDCAKYNLDLQCEIPIGLIESDTGATPIRKRLFVKADAIAYFKKEKGENWRETILEHLRIEQIKLSIKDKEKPTIKDFIGEFGTEEAQDFVDELIKTVCKELIPIVAGNFADKMKLFKAAQNVDSQIRDRSAILHFRATQFTKKHDELSLYQWVSSLILEIFGILVPAIADLTRIAVETRVTTEDWGQEDGDNVDEEPIGLVEPGNS